MRRILICVLLAIATSRLLASEYPTTALSSLADLTRRGQLPQLIEAANSLLANDKLAAADHGMALIYLGYAYQQQGDFTKATADYEKALTLINRDGQHSPDYAAALAALATVYSETGQYDSAKHMLLRSVHLFETDHDREGAAIVWNNLATIAAERHSRHDAHKYMARSIAESQAANNIPTSDIATITTTRGMIAELDKDPDTAIQDYQHALELWKQTNQDQQQRTAWLYVLLGGAYLDARDIANAREMAGRGLALLEATSGTRTPRYFAAQIIYAKVLDASGARDEASRMRKEAQAGMNAGTDRQRAQSQISVAALR